MASSCVDSEGPNSYGAINPGSQHEEAKLYIKIHCKKVLLDKAELVFGIRQNVCISCMHQNMT